MKSRTGVLVLVLAVVLLGAGCANLNPVWVVLHKGELTQ